jgi:hypothetical protein
MKTRLWLLALFGTVLLGGGVAWADGDIYVVAVGGAPVGTKITSVPYYISKSGFYFLGGNLTYSGTSTTGITISADDVTLDMMGCSLTNTNPSGSSDSSIGILLVNNNTEVRNGTVRGFWCGVFGTGCNDCRVINVRTVDNGSGGGIQIVSLSHNTIKGCTAYCSAFNSSPGLGISVQSGLIAGCSAYHCSTGISLSGPGSVVDNIASGNTSHNFYLGDGAATKILVDRNTASGLAVNYFSPNGTSGVLITGSNTGTQ